MNTTRHSSASKVQWVWNHLQTKQVHVTRKCHLSKKYNSDFGWLRWTFCFFLHWRLRLGLLLLHPLRRLHGLFHLRRPRHLHLPHPRLHHIIFVVSSYQGSNAMGLQVSRKVETFEYPSSVESLNLVGNLANIISSILKDRVIAPPALILIFVPTSLQ